MHAVFSHDNPGVSGIMVDGAHCMTVAPSRAGLTPESWDDLYDFLDPGRRGKPDADRNALAEARCVEIRRKLVCFFSARGCTEPEDLAVDTLLRVAVKCREVDSRGYADCTGYFYGVAKNVLHEWQRRSSADVAGRESLRAELLRLHLPGAHSWAEPELVHRYLEMCLAALAAQARQLILSYYLEDRGAKIEHHRALAGETGKSVNSLRIEVHRLRKALRECLFERLRNVSTPSGI
jgi:RNA polymerase sigma factor (sigma-70 family)